MRLSKALPQPDKKQRRAGRTPDSDVDPFVALQGRVQDAQTYFEEKVREWEELEEFYTPEGQRAVLESDMGTDDQLERFRKDIVIQNYSFSTCEQYVATLLEATPAPFVAALDGEQDESATTLTYMLQAYGRSHNVMREVEAVYRDTVVKGNGVWKIYYDSRTDEIRIRAIDPRYVLVDPSADTLDDAEFVCFQCIYSEGLAKKLWPDIDLDEAEPVSTDLEPDDGIDQTDGQNPKVLVHEVYHDFGAKLTVYTGDQILREGDNPFPETKQLSHRYPCTILNFQYDYRKLWVSGLLSQIKGIQEDTNKLNLRKRVHQRLTVNPVVVVHGQTEVKTDPGSVIRLNTNDEKAYYLVPPPIPRDVDDTINGNLTAIDVISGLPEIAKGIKPTGVTSGISLEVLHQASKTRMAGPGRSWTQQLADMWMRCLTLMQTYYAEDRTYATLEGGDVGRVEVSPNDMSSVQPQLDEAGTPMMGEDGAPQGEVVPHDMQILMQTEGELPLGASAQAEMVLQLAQFGPDVFVDQIAVLDAARISGREKIVQRMQQAQQSEMQGQMAADTTFDDGAAQQQAGAGEQMAQQLQQALAPEELEVLRAVVQGEAPPEVLDELLARLDPQVAQLVEQFLEMVGGASQGAPNLQLA